MTAERNERPSGEAKPQAIDDNLHQRSWDVLERDARGGPPVRKRATDPSSGRAADDATVDDREPDDPQHKDRASRKDD